MVLRVSSFSILKIKLWQNFSAIEIYDLYFGFQKNGHVSAMQIQNFQNPLVDAIKNDFG